MAKKLIAMTLAASLVLTFGAVRPGAAKKAEDLLKNVLKGAVVVGITQAVAEQINDGINAITFNKKIPIQAETKVVPIVAVGSGTRVGAAQVSGPKDLVAKTKAVFQIETKLGYKNLDVEIMVPSESLNPLEFNRVEGVGVTAIIDLRLSGL